jgi:thiamine-monophosphate kinase
MNESDIVERLRKLFPRAGDDAAVIGNDVITTDMLIEDTDFTRAIPLRNVARKSLASNLSDLAAMGARPAYAVVALAVRDDADAELFMLATAQAAAEYKIEIVGGDLSCAERMIVSIAAIGHVQERAILRSTAKAGDRIYVSRPLGGSAAGLALITRWASVEPPADLAFAQREFAQSAIRRHIDPEPEVELGMLLAAIREVSACIDISDGLSTDLHHLCDASSLGAEIERERIPVFADLARNAAAFGIEARNAILHGGEEYALLFTSSLRESDLSTRLKRPVYAIGRMTAERGVRLDGQPLRAEGWDHFNS